MVNSAGDLEVSSNFWIINKADSNNYLKISSSNLEFFKNVSGTSTSIASFGSTSRIGPLNSKHIALDSAGMKVYKGSETDANRMLDISSSGMNVYEDGSSIAQLGKVITLGNASGSTGANFNTVITSDTFSINAGRNPSFMIQSTGDQQQVETRVLAQQAFSVNSSSQKTKTWNLQLKALTASPYTYTLTLSSGVSTTFTVSPSTYNTPSTLSTTVMGSQNTVSLTVNKVNYVSGSIDSIDVTVTQVAKVSTSKAGKVFYSGVWITYSSLVYTTAIAWNGSDIFNLGEIIAVNGGTDYTTDVSVTSSPETVRSIGSITLDEGVYVCSVLARFVPTTRTAGTVCHTRMNLNTVSGNTSAQSIVCNTTSGGSASASASIIWNWNQHNATFIANVTMAEGATYYVNVSSDVPGVWKRDTPVAFSIRAVKIK